MGLKGYRKRYVILVCSSIILFALGNQYFFQSYNPKSFLLSYNISLVHVPSENLPAPPPLPLVSLTNFTQVVRNEGAESSSSGEVGLLSSPVSPNPSSFAGKAVWTKLSPISKAPPQTRLKLKKYPFEKKLYRLKKKSNRAKEKKPTTQSPRPACESNSLISNLSDEVKATASESSNTSQSSSLRASSTSSNSLYPTSDHLKECRKLALEAARNTLTKEMSNYKFVDNTKLEDHLLETGGKPIRNILITTWRSGSTFLGETIVTHAGSFYHYEPLLPFGIVQVREEPLVSQAVSNLRDLMHCNYDNMSDYINFGREKTYLFTHNARLWKYCITNEDICMDPDFLGEMCKIFPIQAIKTVRLRLKLVKQLLDDPDFNLRVLYLVRDPRGTMQSRLHRDWCAFHPDCSDPQALCSDLEDDFYEAEKLRADYPDRFMAIRFEDMTANVVAAAKQIFRFLRLQYVGLVDEFIGNHTMKNYGGPSSTYRDTKAAPFHWIQDLQNNTTYVRRIQDSCTTALNLWGYNLLNIPQDLTSPDFRPVNSPPWPNMTFTDSLT